MPRLILGFLVALTAATATGEWFARPLSAATSATCSDQVGDGGTVDIQSLDVANEEDGVVRTVIQFGPGTRRALGLGVLYVRSSTKSGVLQLQLPFTSADGSGFIATPDPGGRLVRPSYLPPPERGTRPIPLIWEGDQLTIEIPAENLDNPTHISLRVATTAGVSYDDMSWCDYDLLPYGPPHALTIDKANTKIHPSRPFPGGYVDLDSVHLISDGGRSVPTTDFTCSATLAGNPLRLRYDPGFYCEWGPLPPSAAHDLMIITVAAPYGDGVAKMNIRVIVAAKRR